MRELTGGWGQARPCFLRELSGNYRASARSHTSVLSLIKSWTCRRATSKQITLSHHVPGNHQDSGQAPERRVLASTAFLNRGRHSGSLQSGLGDTIMLMLGHSGPSVLKLNYFRKTHREAICLKNKSPWSPERHVAHHTGISMKMLSGQEVRIKILFDN